MAPQVYTDNNRHANIGDQHIVYDQHNLLSMVNKSEQVSLDVLGYTNCKKQLIWLLDL